MSARNHISNPLSVPFPLSVFPISCFFQSQTFFFLGHLSDLIAEQYIRVGTGSTYSSIASCHFYFCPSSTFKFFP